MTNLTMEDLTGFEVIELKKVLGVKSLDQADEMAAYGIAYLFKKRQDPSITYSDVLGMSLREVKDYMGLEDETVAEPFSDESPKE